MIVVDRHTHPHLWNALKILVRANDISCDSPNSELDGHDCIFNFPDNAQWSRELQLADSQVARLSSYEVWTLCDGEESECMDMVDMLGLQEIHKVLNAHFNGFDPQ